MFIIFIFALTHMLSTLSAREVSVLPFVGSHHIVMHKATPFVNDSIVVSTCKIYVTSIHDINAHVTLLNLDQGNVFVISDSTESLQFGIDSNQTIHTSFSDALDPLHGMFWTWNTGYIHCKIEGHIIRAHNQRRAFQLHLGGYTSPYATIYRMNIPKGNQPLTISIDIKPCLEQLIQENTYEIMLPGKKAKEMSDLFYSSMSITN